MKVEYSAYDGDIKKSISRFVFDVDRVYFSQEYVLIFTTEQTLKIKRSNISYLQVDTK